MLNRREFIAACSAAGLAGHTVGAETMPYESLRELIQPGHDAFTEERMAQLVVERLRKSRPGRYYPLPNNLVRYEIAAVGQNREREYRTGYYRMNWSSGDTTIRGVIDEQVASSEAPLFRDITSSVFSKTASFRDQLARGIPYWRARLDPACGIDVFGMKGVAVGDIDNDGTDEVYVLQPGGLPNRLYKLVEGAMEDITERAGVGLLDDSASALFVDFRNLGRQDLVVLLPTGPVLLLNDGHGRFSVRTNAFQFARPPQGSFTGMAAADYDRDGIVDLYLCAYVYFQSEAQYRYPAPYHDAQNGPPNFLFRNRLAADGSGHFDDVTQSCGIDTNNNRYSFAAAWCDYDGSGWPSLYVANDFGRNNLYKNDKGRFRDVAAEAGVEDIGPGMSASWFDYDGDGRLDLYVSNMWSDCGQRITASPAFRPARHSPELAEAYRRHSKGNSLYRNLGDGRFEETGPKERVELGRWAWASDGHDFDNDGSPEIFITCGMLSNKSREDVMGFFWRQVVANAPVDERPSEAYENGWNALNQYIREDYPWSAPEPNVFYARRNGRYVDCSGISGLDIAEDSRAFAVTDFDGDGRLDLIVKNRLGPQVRVFQNNCAADRHSIAFLLRGSKSNRDAIGAMVRVDGQVKVVQAGSAFLSQHTKKLYFGLAASDTAKHVEVKWPSGLEQTFTSLQAGRLYAIQEGSEDLSSILFQAPHRFPEPPPIPVDNEPRLHTTWFLEPVPLPVPAKSPGLLVVNPSGSDVDIWRVFRRYLFDYRAELTPPLLLLIDTSGRARRIYHRMPSPADVRADLAELTPRVLPFEGRFWATTPSRDYFKLGAAFFQAGHSDQALPYLEEVVRGAPENERALMTIAQIHLDAGRVGDARAAVRRLLAVTPRSVVAADHLGLCFAEKGLYPEARDLFQRGMRIQRNYPPVLNNLGVLYLKMGQPADAIAAFRYGIREAPDDDMLYLNLGRVYTQAGEREKARAVILEWLERKPGNENARRALREVDSR
jgi:thioredoxin-like negative regulator of GroEL